jgi:sulfonate transport system substrate-binding protein
MKKTLKHKGLFLIMIMIALLLSACGGNGSPESSGSEASNKNGETAKEGKTIRIGYINSTGNSDEGKPAIGAAEGWAIEKGFLQEELEKVGITNFEYFAFPNGPNLNEAMAAGELDLGIFGDTPALIAKSSGHKTRLIGLSAVNQDIWLVTNKENGVKSVEDLKGKTVSTSNGSYMYRYLIGLLEEKKLLDEVEIVTMFPPEAAAALERGDIHAYAFPTYMGPKHVKLGFPVVEQASKSTPQLTGTSVIVGAEKFLEKNPEFLSAWNSARAKAVKDLKENGEEFYQYSAEVTKQDLDVVKESLPLDNIREESFPEDGIELLNGTKQFLVHQELIKKDFELEDWILRD